MPKPIAVRCTREVNGVVASAPLGLAA